MAVGVDPVMTTDEKEKEEVIRRTYSGDIFGGELVGGVRDEQAGLEKDEQSCQLSGGLVSQSVFRSGRQSVSWAGPKNTQFVTSRVNKRASG